MTTPIAAAEASQLGECGELRLKHGHASGSPMSGDAVRRKEAVLSLVFSGFDLRGWQENFRGHPFASIHTGLRTGQRAGWTRGGRGERFQNRGHFARRAFGFNKTGQAVAIPQDLRRARTVLHSRHRPLTFPLMRVEVLWRG
jgi:hypothetical protein